MLAFVTPFLFIVLNFSIMILFFQFYTRKVVVKTITENVSASKLRDTAFSF